MSNLRSEYKKYKQEREKYINEAAYAWVEKNIILINEKIDRRNVKRLSDAIVKFDEKFGPFKDKIPAIASHLENAENNLQLVLTGRVNDKNASDMLQQLSYLYKLFSDFFGTDLPILLNTSIFAAARQNPDVRLDSIQPGEGIDHNPKVIRDTFKHSIEPSKDEMRLIRKIYRKRNIPLVDATGIANQLLALSYNELQSLTGIEKIPMVATEDQPIDESVELNESVLLEIDLQKLKALNADIEKLERIFQPFAKKLPSLEALLNQLRDQVLQIQNNAGSGAWDKIKSIFGGGIQKNILATHDIFRDFKEIATEIVKMMKGADPHTPLYDLTSDSTFGKRAQNAIGLLGKAVKPSIFGKSVIDPKTFQNEISRLSLSEIDSLAKGIDLEPTEEVDPNLENPVPEQQSEPVDPYQIGDLEIQKTAQKSAATPETAPEPASTAPVVPNARKRGQVEPIDIGVDTTPQSQPQTQSQTTPAETGTVEPQRGLTPEEVLNAIAKNKRVNKTIQKSIADAVEWLNNNGFKVVQ